MGLVIKSLKNQKMRGKPLIFFESVKRGRSFLTLHNFRQNCMLLNDEINEVGFMLRQKWLSLNDGIYVNLRKQGLG